MRQFFSTKKNKKYQGMNINQSNKQTNKRKKNRMFTYKHNDEDDNDGRMYRSIDFLFFIFFFVRFR